jgi:hypothetical protein
MTQTPTPKPEGAKGPTASVHPSSIPATPQAPPKISIRPTESVEMGHDPIPIQSIDEIARMMQRGLE